MPGCAHIDAAIFDYGGVLAEEGFREGMYAIARSRGLDPQAVLDAGADAAWGTGWVVGQADEAAFWADLARRSGVAGEPAALRREVLSRFVLRDWMPSLLDRLAASGLTLAVLSDQTNWLDELEARDRFLHHFDLVVNSYRYGKSKREAAIFTEVAERLGIAPGRALFIDDTPGNGARARAAGLRAHLYQDRAGLLAVLAEACPGLENLHA
ncbi:MAG: HAD-IA family hydrolase [Thermodesulfobacteriota bacterium]